MNRRIKLPWKKATRFAVILACQPCVPDNRGDYLEDSSLIYISNYSTQILASAFISASHRGKFKETDESVN